MKNKNRFSKQRNIHKFLITEYFSNTKGYAVRTIGNYVLVKQVKKIGGMKWEEVAVFTKDAFQKRKMHGNHLFKAGVIKTRGNSESESK